MIDERASLHFWDMTLDASMHGDEWMEKSLYFSPGWFGPLAADDSASSMGNDAKRVKVCCVCKLTIPPSSLPHSLTHTHLTLTLLLSCCSLLRA